MAVPRLGGADFGVPHAKGYSIWGTMFWAPLFQETTTMGGCVGLDKVISFCWWFYRLYIGLYTGIYGYSGLRL